MKYFNRALMAALAVLLFAGLAAAQQKPEQKTQRIVPLKVEIVLSEYAGAKKISSLPYTLEANATTSGDPRSLLTQLRLGVQVPVSNGPHGFQYQNVGTKIDCWARAIGDGRYELYLDAERTSVSEPGAKRGTEGLRAQNSAPPIVRHLDSSNTIILRNGQTSESMVATDPVSGHVLRVSVTLHVANSAH